MKYIYALFIVCMFISQITWGQAGRQHQKDSLRNVIATTEGDAKLKAYLQLTNMFYIDVFKDLQNRDTLFTLYKEMRIVAEQHGDLKYVAIILLNKAKLNNDTRLVDEAINAANEHLIFCVKHELWQYYYEGCQLLVRIYRQGGEYDKAIDEANKMYNHAKERNNENGLAISLYSMSEVYGAMGRYDDEEKCLRESIKLMRKLDMDLMLTSNYFRLCQCLKRQKRYDKAIAELAEYEKVITQSEKATLTKNSIGWSDYWIISADIYCAAKDYDKAEFFCEKIEELNDNNFRNKLAIHHIRAQIYEMKKDYKKALEEVNLRMELDKNPTSIFPTKLQKARLYSRMGQFDTADSLYMDAFATADSTYTAKINAKVDELHVQYEVDKISAEKERNRNYFILALAMCILLTIALGIWIYYSRKIAKKNRTMVVQIKELQVQQEKLETELLNKTTFEIEYNGLDDENICPESRKDKLCIVTRDIILKEKAYRDPNLNREMLIERLGTNKDLFTEAFQFCFKMSFKDYITQLRLKDAIILLEQSDLSIEGISEKSGFGTVRTFQRQFQSKYNMSPKDYRKALVI